LLNNRNINIISGPIGIGKTTMLERFCEERNDVGGFLTHAQADFRRLLKFPSNLQSIELNWNESMDKSKKLEVGKFIFNNDSFTKALLKLEDDYLNPDLKYLMVDEIGKLEVQRNSGFEPKISKFIEKFKSDNKGKKLIIVVRDSLFKLAIDKYKFQGAAINSGPFVSLENTLSGVVLAGGESRRMGKDKAIMEYHHMPQWQWTKELISPFCESVFVSSNSLDIGIKDDKKFENNGPISGILTIYSKYPKLNLFVLGVDYPNLNLTSVTTLVDVFKLTGRSVFYINDETDRIEPLIGIYNNELLNYVKSEFINGENSLSRILQKSEACFVRHRKSEVLKSFDYPHE